MGFSGRHTNSWFRAWLHSEVILKKLASPVGAFFCIILALITAFLAAKGYALIIFGMIGALIGAMVIYTCVFRPLIGYYLTSLVAYFAFYPNHLLNTSLPLSTGVEVLVTFLMLGTLWAGKKDINQRGTLYQAGISILLVINFIYYLVQLFNPNMDSTAGWLFAGKRYVIYMLVYIITYRLINTPDRFRFFFKFWIGMAFLGGLYGCFQQWFGYLPMELSYIKNDPHEYALLFQNGVLRKFSFFDGVITFGVLVGSMAVVTIILAINEKNKFRRRLLFFMSLILFLGMSYSGTRTFTIMIPAGIALYSLMTIRNKTTLITVFVILISFAFMMTAPIDSPTLNRMRSTFNSDDASLDVRNVNRHRIQPYMYAHPIGGGVGTSGVEGERFNPGHPLAGFPPDSGLLKIALDMGWIGLALNMLFYLAIFWQGIQYYFRMRNEEYKKYLIAITAGVFAIMVTLYSQVSVGQMPTAIYFYAVLAMIRRLMEFDKNEFELARNQVR